jgi:hypothetical protein
MVSLLGFFYKASAKMLLIVLILTMAYVILGGIGKILHYYPFKFHYLTGVIVLLALSIFLAVTSIVARKALHVAQYKEQLALSKKQK